MDNLSALLGFIDTARSERKYAESTARGLKAAVKLFANHVSEAEAASLQVLLRNLDDIGADIYAKRADENITVTTLVVYKRRLRKLVHDYFEYGRSPDKMAAWNPRRHTAALRPRTPEPEAGLPAGQAPVLIQPAQARSSNLAGARLATPASQAQPDAAHLPGEAPSVIMNRSEISLRPQLRIALELPADMTPAEAAKLKQLIDLMQPPQ